MSIHTLPVTSKLHGNPTQKPQWGKTVKTASGETLAVANPTATRALIALMDMAAVQGGAASHFGGPSAFAEIMSSVFGFMFWQSEKDKKQWGEAFHFVNDAGHCENGIYALRANYNVGGASLETLRGFRSIESVFTGHGEAHLNPHGVYISNGPLGSGLPQAQGLALAEGLSSNPRTTICTISDGGCMEGEAREAMAAIPGFAAKGKLGPFILIASDNNTKLSGRIDSDSFSMEPTFRAMKDLGWKTIHVEDGHDLQKVFSTVESAYQDVKKNPQQPIFIWAKTIKGKGVAKTESSSSGGHGFPLKTANELPAFLQEIYKDQEMPHAFKQWEQELVQAEAKKTEGSASDVKPVKIQDGVAKALIDGVEKLGLPVISVSSDLQGSTGVEGFRKKFPQHALEVGIAEANMVSVAIGLSKQGFIPIVDTFAQFGVTKGALPFIMSGLSEAPVIGIFSHTGFQDAADGASHQALAYVAMLGAIPHVDVYTLTCAEEAYALLTQTLTRFTEDRKAGKTPRSTIFFLGRETFPPAFVTGAQYQLGAAQVVSDNSKDFSKSVTLVVGGSLLAYGVKAAKILAAKHNIGTILINPSIMNHPDVKTISQAVSQSGGFIVSLEDHRRIGGQSAYLAQALLNQGVAVKKMISLGASDEFGRSSYQADHLYKIHHMNEEALVEAALSMVK
ncbi:MAG: transketolase [Bdellovibrionaceae bacterium]|nr:transketolase [Pseudobdellovibrionaceae bacterium]